MRLLIASIFSLSAVAACGSTKSAGGPDANGDSAGSGTPDTPSGSTTVDVTIVDHPTNAANFDFIVAYQDGDGAWTIAPAPTGDVYALPISSGRYGVAYTCAGTAAGGGGNAAVIREVVAGYFTVATHPSLTTTVAARCTDRITTVTVSGAVKNLGTGATGRFAVHLGDRTADVNGTTGAYTIDVPAGTYDVVLAHSPAAAVGATDTTVDKALVQRGVDVTAAMTLDLDYSTAAATQSFPVTMKTTGNDRASTTTVLYTANGTTFDMDHDTNTLATVGLAASQAAGTDVYDQQMQVAGTGQAAETTNATSSPAALTYTAPAPLGGALATVAAATPYPQIKSTWTAYTNAVGYEWGATQAQTGAACGGGAACTTAWAVELSSDWLGTSAEYQMPDLSKLTGWNAVFQFVTGTQVTGTVQAVTSSKGAGDFPAGTPVAGTQRTFASSDWTAMP